MRSAATANQSVEKLSTHIAEWILDPTNKKAFADAIKLGKATYERERQELINAVKGAVPVASRQRALRPTAPEPWAQDAGSIALQVFGMFGSAVATGTKYAVDTVRSVSALAVDYGITNSATALDKEFPTIDENNALTVFVFLQHEPSHGGTGWEVEKNNDVLGCPMPKGRTSMKTHILWEVAWASIIKSELKKQQFESEVKQIKSQPLKARNLFFETKGAMEEIIKARASSVQPQQPPR